MAERAQITEPAGEVVVYEAPDGGVHVEVIVGDETVWLTQAQMVDLFGRAKRLAYRLLGDVTAAEDVVAEALARALVHWDRVGELPYRDGWVLRVTTNLALDASRRDARRKAILSTATRNDHERSAADELVVLRAALVAALVALPRRQREAIVLVHLVGLTPTEAAVSMQVSVSSVSQHVRRGLDHLRGHGDFDLPPLDLKGALL